MSKHIFLAVLLGTFCAIGAMAQGVGRIDGRVTGPDDQSVSGITVVIQETADAAVTDRNGRFSFARVPAGTYTIIFTLGNNSVMKEGVAVTAAATASVDMKVDWDIGFAEMITVYSASRRVERVVDAPAAVTIVSEEEIQREASHGQLPKLLEFTPGAEVTQSGLYDYNFNTRGFNSSLNRRVATLIDGRDPSVPFLGAQEWAAVSFPLDDVASLELVRGPSAALYGANASSGVLNMVTRAPRYSQGGLLRLTAGETSTYNADFRWAGELGANWYLKVTGGARDTGDFTVSRNEMVEYPGLPPEAVPLRLEDDDQLFFGGVRADKYFSNGSLFTLEGGSAEIEGPVFQTGIGRVQLVDVERPWARINYTMDHWNFLAYYNKRDASEQLALSTGANLVLDTENLFFEAQTSWNLANERVRVVAGASYGEEDIDSLDPATGLQTLMFQPVDEDFTAVFGQLDWSISEKVKLVVAGRWDDSSLHDSQVSPKGSIVYSFTPNQSLRFTYNEAFQVANYSEFFLQSALGAFPLLGFATVICSSPLLPEPVDCGITGNAPILAVGNASLDLEEIKTFELGYSGIIANKAFLTVDYYNSDNKNFITDLVPQAIGDTLTNPNFGPWVGTPESETTEISPGLTVADALRNSVASTLLPLGFALSNNLDGAPIVVARSYTNFGDVDTQGIDLGLNYYIGDKWNVSFAASWFDFDIKNAGDPFADQLLPNSPESKAAGAITYASGEWDASLSARWVDDFRWVVGPFQGNVESYTTVDVVANYRVNENWTVGLNVANLTDDEHWESFGGDILERRALAHLAFTWD